MGNAWFRFYHEWDSDPKVQSMSEPMQRRLAMLFCSRCREETLHETDRAFHWRISPEELAETKALFLEKGFIDENWNLFNWNRRQFLSDSSTERVRRYRQGLKQSETLHVVTGKQYVTGLSASVSVSESDSSSELCLANWLLEELGVVADNSVRRVAADAIRLLAKEGGTTETASQFILEAGKQAVAAGEVINRFWFTDQRYRPQANRNGQRKPKILSKPYEPEPQEIEERNRKEEERAREIWESATQEFKKAHPFLEHSPTGEGLPR
jgi:hypothetical protein